MGVTMTLMACHLWPPPTAAGDDMVAAAAAVVVEGASVDTHPPTEVELFLPALEADASSPSSAAHPEEAKQANFNSILNQQPIFEEEENSLSQFLRHFSGL